MDLDAYYEWAADESDWFRKRLLEAGVEALQRSCAALGEAGVRAVAEYRRAEIDDLLQTPKNRRGPKLRAIPAGTERHAFLIGAAHTVRCGRKLLQLATDYGLAAGPAKSFLLVQAAGVAQRLQAEFPPLWPLEDVPDPFSGAMLPANDDEV